MPRPSKNSSGQKKDPKTGKYRTGRPPKIKVGAEKKVVDEQGNQMVVREIILGADIVAKLENAFSVRATDTQACIHAGISKATLYRFLDQNPEFRERFDTLREMIPLQAKTNVARDIMAGDTKTAQWLLERVDPEYSTKIKQDSTVKELPPMPPNIDLTKLSDDELEQFEMLLQKAETEPQIETDKQNEST